MPHIIHIFGGSGSGTTTLASFLAQKTGFAHMDSDDYFWLPTDPPFTEKRAPDERVAMMRKDIEKHGDVVISGSLCGWGDGLIPSFTLAVRLVIDPETRLARLRKREYERFGERIGEGGDMEKIHRNFMAWAARYDTDDPSVRSRAEHDMWQKQLLCPLIVLDGAETLEKNAQKIAASM